MANEVLLVRQADLDDGVDMIFKRFGRRVHMAFDPAMTTEPAARQLLNWYLAAGVVDAVHHTDA